MNQEKKPINSLPESDITALYEQLRDDGTPALLDKIVIEQARQQKMTRAFRGQSWMQIASVAAVLILSVGLFANYSDLFDSGQLLPLDEAPTINRDNAIEETEKSSTTADLQKFGNQAGKSRPVEAELKREKSLQDRVEPPEPEQQRITAPKKSRLMIRKTEAPESPAPAAGSAAISLQSEPAPSYRNSPQSWYCHIMALKEKGETQQATQEEQLMAKQFPGFDMASARKCF